MTDSERDLIVSDGATFTTSYANIARNFGTELVRQGREIAFGSFQHGGVGKLWYEILPGKMVPFYGVDQGQRIKSAIQDYKPTRIIHIRDLLAHKLQYHPAAYSIKAQAGGVPVWGWVPIQSEEFPWEFVDAAIREYDKTLTFTSWAAEAMGDRGMPRERLDVLMPGVDPAYSNPDITPIDPENRAFRRDGVKIVLSIGEPRTWRKAFPSLMAGYATIAGRVDLDWYLHTAYVGHYQLLEHAKMLGVAGHFTFPRDYNLEQNIPLETFVRYYRKAAAYVASGTGEGLNMPLMEAAAMGLPVVFPGFPNNVEVVSDYPEALRFPVKTHPIPYPNTWESLMDHQDLGRAIEAAVQVPADFEAGRRYYDAHSWERCVKRYLSL